MLQHVISGGIVLYCIFETAFSNLGKQALFWHIPALFIFGTDKSDVFFLGFVAVLIIEGTSILVLLLANSRTSYFSQVINIYCWPLQLNLFAATLAAAFFLTGGHSIPIYVISIVFLLIFFGSFAVSSKDIARYLHNRWFWIFSTISIAYFAALFAFTGWVFFLHQLGKLSTLPLHSREFAKYPDRVVTQSIS